MIGRKVGRSAGRWVGRLELGQNSMERPFVNAYLSIRNFGITHNNFTRTGLHRFCFMFVLRIHSIQLL